MTLTSFVITWMLLQWSLELTFGSLIVSVDWLTVGNKVQNLCFEVKMAKRNVEKIENIFIFQFVFEFSQKFSSF